MSENDPGNKGSEGDPLGFSMLAEDENGSMEGVGNSLDAEETANDAKVKDRENSQSSEEANAESSESAEDSDDDEFAKMLDEIFAEKPEPEPEVLPQDSETLEEPEPESEPEEPKEEPEKSPEEIEKERFTITPETKIDDIEENLEKYLEYDINISSNMLAYALKKKKAEDPEGFKSILGSEGVRKKLGETEDIRAQLGKMNERIEKLESFEYGSLVFLLPMDQLMEGGIELPVGAQSDGKYLASGDVTAIVKGEKKFGPEDARCWRIEGVPDSFFKNMQEQPGCYREETIGKEVSQFPVYSAEMAALYHFLSQKGLKIPKWDEIAGCMATAEGKGYGYGVEQKSGEERKEIAEKLVENYGLDLNGDYQYGIAKGVGAMANYVSTNSYGEVGFLRFAKDEAQNTSNMRDYLQKYGLFHLTQVTAAVRVVHN